MLMTIYILLAAHLRVSEGSYIDSRDMGVTHCRLFMDSAAFGRELRGDTA